jgi:hypothetical protein
MSRGVRRAANAIRNSSGELASSRDGMQKANLHRAQGWGTRAVILLTATEAHVSGNMAT